MSSTLHLPGWQERATAGTRNAALALGLTGATVGLALGLAGGLARQSARAGAVAAVPGPGAGCGRGSRSRPGRGPARVPRPRAGSREHVRRDGLVAARARPSLGGRRRRRAGWPSAIGLGGRARAGRGLLGGLLGAVAGAFLYEMIGALALPGSKDHRAHRRDMGSSLAGTVPGRHPARSRSCGARS